MTNYLTNGGKLFVSGAEIAWDLDFLNNGRSFYKNQLQGDYVADDANTYSVNGTNGSIFEGLSFSFDNGSQFYNVDFPDVIAPTSNEQILDNDDGSSVYSETGSWSTATAPGYDGGTYRFALTGQPSTAEWDFFVSTAGQGEVFVQFRSGVNRASNAVYQIDTGNGVENASVDQTQNDSQWVSLGTFDFTNGSHQIVLDAQASSGGSVVISDVVQVVMEDSSTVTADFDTDGDIDGSDFLAWQRGVGSANPSPSDGDANGDDQVDGEDLAVWEGQFATNPAIKLTSLNYVGGTGGGAGIQFDSGDSTKVINFGFPFETITDEQTRNEVMARVLEFFEFDAQSQVAASTTATGQTSANTQELQASETATAPESLVSIAQRVSNFTESAHSAKHANPEAQPLWQMDRPHQTVEQPDTPGRQASDDDSTAPFPAYADSFKTTLPENAWERVFTELGTNDHWESLRIREI